ncbi:MAG: hypothetical protein RSE62_03530 [Citrobacter sp.]
MTQHIQAAFDASRHPDATPFANSFSNFHIAVMFGMTLGGGEDSTHCEYTINHIPVDMAHDIYAVEGMDISFAIYATRDDQRITYHIGERYRPATFSTIGASIADIEQRTTYTTTGVPLEVGKYTGVPYSGDTPPEGAKNSEGTHEITCGDIAIGYVYTWLMSNGDIAYTTQAN